MPSMMSSLKTLAKPAFWVDALVVIGGVKACDFANAMIGSKIPAPALVQALSGPAIVIFASGFVGGKHGGNLRTGAAVHAAGTALAAMGVA